MLATLNSMYHMRVHKVSKFKPKIKIEKKIGNFIYKTVTNSDELRGALQLRFEVFHRELLNKTRSYGVDVDEYDALCDHLIIVDTKKNLIVGTYRLNCSLFTDKFYSQNEFIMARILAQPGIKLELGRACIRQNYRRGMVISMLWKGIAEYMTASQSELLFGCATVMTEQPAQAALLYRYFLEEQRVSQKFFAPPTLAFTMPGIQSWIPHPALTLSKEERELAEQLIPGLCRSYLHLGAQVAGEPAYDRGFKCIDFLMLLNKADLRQQLWHRLGRES